MTNTNEFQAVIARKDWDRAATMVRARIDSEISDWQAFRDWLEEGSYTGNETPESLAVEWMALDNMVEGIDY